MEGRGTAMLKRTDYRFVRKKVNGKEKVESSVNTALLHECSKPIKL